MNERKAGLWSWVWQRLTAVLLAVGLLVHFLVVHFTVDRPVTFDKVRARLDSPVWIWFDLALLALALYHALNGTHGILIDWGLGPRGRRIAGAVFWAIGIATFFVGWWILRPFAPVG